MTTLDDDTEEDTIHCATCGVQVSLKKAMVHMEKCFMKVKKFLTVKSFDISHVPVGGKCIICWFSEE